MATYEVVLIFKPMEEEALETAITRWEEVIKNGEGEITKSDRWGKRRLAYELKGFNEGYYLCMEIAASGSLVQELDRVLKISDDVIRHLIIRTDT